MPFNKKLKYDIICLGADKMFKKYKYDKKSKKIVAIK